MSFFKKETKEDKERKRLEKKTTRDSSINMPPMNSSFMLGADGLPCIEHLDMPEEHTDGTTRGPLKIQSNSRSTIESHGQPAGAPPPLLPKPKKGILKTMSKFGIGPTLSNLGSSNGTNGGGSGTSSSLHNQSQQRSASNLKTTSSPKIVAKLFGGSNGNVPSSTSSLIEYSIPNYSKRNSQLSLHDLNIEQVSLSTNKRQANDNFLLPPLRKLPAFLVSNGHVALNGAEFNISEPLSSLIRCVEVNIRFLNQINLIECDNNADSNNAIIVSCSNLR